MCSFFVKTGSCRFGEKCSRSHPVPGVTGTVVLRGMYSNYAIEHGFLDQFDADISLEYDQDTANEDFVEFYNDILPEFEKIGRLTQLKVCCNWEPHLRGNVYVRFRREEDSCKAIEALNGRFYAGKSLTCDHVTIEKWRAAICGLFRFGRCPKGKNCNYLHVFKNPGNRFFEADHDYTTRSMPHSVRGFGSTRRDPYGRFSERGTDHERHRHRQSSSRRFRSPTGERSSSRRASRSRRSSRRRGGSSSSEDEARTRRSRRRRDGSEDEDSRRKVRRRNDSSEDEAKKRLIRRRNERGDNSSSEDDTRKRRAVRSNNGRSSEDEGRKRRTGWADSSNNSEEECGMKRSSRSKRKKKKKKRKKNERHSRSRSKSPPRKKTIKRKRTEKKSDSKKLDSDEENGVRTELENFGNGRKSDRGEGVVSSDGNDADSDESDGKEDLTKLAIVEREIERLKRKADEKRRCGGIKIDEMTELPTRGTEASSGQDGTDLKTIVTNDDDADDDEKAG